MSLFPILGMAPAASIPSQLPNDPIDMDTTADAVVTIVKKTGLALMNNGAGKSVRSSILWGQPSPKLRKVVGTYSNFKGKAIAETGSFQQQSREPEFLFSDSDNHLTCKFADSKGLKYVNEQFPNLESLTLQDCPALMDFYLGWPLAHLTKLTLDNLPHCKGSSLSNFTDGPNVRLPALQHLIIKNCSLVDNISLFYIAELLRQELTHIEFENLSSITSEGLAHIQGAIESFSGRLPLRSIIIIDRRLEKSSSDDAFKASYKSLQDAVRNNGWKKVTAGLRRSSFTQVIEK